MVCVGGASVMKSESGEGEPVVEDDWSEGREDDCMNEEERVELFGQEELGVAGGERLVSALVVASRERRRWETVASMRRRGKTLGADGGGGRQGERGEGERGERLEKELGVSGGEWLASVQVTELKERRR